MATTEKKEFDMIVGKSIRDSLVAQTVKNLPANAEDEGPIPGSGRSPGKGNSYPLQYSCLENPTDRGAWQATVHGTAKNQAWLCNQHFPITVIIMTTVKPWPD